MLWPEQWGLTTCLMGVINITPDSFSDGGVNFNADRALLTSTEFIDKGADVLDLGAQSTRPGAFKITPEEEINRLLPSLKLIRKTHQDQIISIDTFSSKVAECAIENGADWINDVSGGTEDKAILNVVAEADCPYVLMHSRGNSQTMDTYCNYKDLMLEIRNELLVKTEEATNNGVREANLIWDPGIGFAKTTEQNLYILKNISYLQEEGFPLLIGPSRKRFIGDVLNVSNPNERIWGTAAVVCRCVQANVNIIRVHDVGPMSEIIEMSRKLWEK